MGEHVTIGNAKRSERKPFYRFIPFVAIRRIAEALTEGALKYSDTLHNLNWKRGGAEFSSICFDHAIEHLYKWQAGDKSEDHLGHAAANLVFMMWFEARGVFVPKSDDELLGSDLFTGSEHGKRG